MIQCSLVSNKGSLNKARYDRTTMNRYETIDQLILDSTRVGSKSLRNLIRLSHSVSGLQGDIAEVGVYNGGSALLLCRLNPNGHIYLFDTFEGLPEVTKQDNYHLQGDFNDASERRVKKLLKDYNHWRIYKGTFPADTGKAIENIHFRLVHLDVNTYTSYRDALQFFYHRMIRDGVIIMDDYGSNYCLGAKKAIDKFIRDKPERLIIGPERQAHFFKE